MEVNKPTLEPWTGVDDWNLLHRTGSSLTPLQARGLTFQKVPAASSRSLRCCTAEKQRNCQGNWIFSSALLRLYLHSSTLTGKNREVSSPVSRFESFYFCFKSVTAKQFRSQCDNCNVECSLLNHQIGTRYINHLWLTPGRLVGSCIIYSFSLRRHRRGYFTISYLLVVAKVGVVVPAQKCECSYMHAQHTRWVRGESKP